MVGPAAALGALFLYALDPTIVAHSALVTTDVGLAAFTMLFVFALWRYVHQPTWRRLVVCGVALGAVLGTKFSAVFLLPVGVVLVVAAAAATASGKRAAKAGPNDACPCGSGKKFKKCHGGASAGRDSSGTPRQRTILLNVGAFGAMCVVAAVVIEVIYFFPGDPFLYVAGLKKVNADHAAGYMAYLHGDLAKRFYSYFAAAYLLKEPLATVLLSAAGLVLLLRSKSAPLLTKLFLLVPPLVMFLAPTFLADDMGIRYIIPVLPFAYLLGGAALAALFEKMPWGRYVAAALCLWVVVAAAGIYPDHLSYFNESACLLESPGRIGWDGGTRCGPMWLEDSNVDWGQGLKQLREWMERRAQGRTVRLGYFGSYPPEGYGLRFEKVGIAELLPEPSPGLYAISAHLVARIPPIGADSGQGAWLRRLAPADIVGHAFYIYDVR
jgi:hypothetical protein